MLAQNLERRFHPRAPLDVLANRFVAGYPYLCRATDISREGMRVLRLNEPDLAARFSGVQFQLPGCPEILSAAAEVVFDDQGTGAVGLRFTHLPAQTASAIDRFVSRFGGRLE